MERERTVGLLESSILKNCYREKATRRVFLEKETLLDVLHATATRRLLINMLITLKGA